jgi:dihydroxyacid dehydratase/phosphogluconate dehydratase
MHICIAPVEKSDTVEIDINQRKFHLPVSEDDQSLRRQAMDTKNNNW